jgi:hypothetical protein
VVRTSTGIHTPEPARRDSRTVRVSERFASDRLFVGVADTVTDGGVRLRDADTSAVADDVCGRLSLTVGASDGDAELLADAVVLTVREADGDCSSDDVGVSATVADGVCGEETVSDAVELGTTDADRDDATDGELEGDTDALSDARALVEADATLLADADRSSVALTVGFSVRDAVLLTDSEWETV